MKVLSFCATGAQVQEHPLDKLYYSTKMMTVTGTRRHSYLFVSQYFSTTYFNTKMTKLALFT